ncbi:MAG: hypothetical protein E6H87_13870 [Chloroflexi bacterium]|nr:MAG: hypothetical protein E6H87_13870 [Chloroflexota bacterium]
MPTPAQPRPLEQNGLELVGHSDLGGRGDGMQVMRNGDVLYVGHMGDFGVGTSVVDIADPARPKVLRQISVPKGTHSHKVQLADGLLLANHEQYPYRVVVRRGQIRVRLGAGEGLPEPDPDRRRPGGSDESAACLALVVARTTRG